MTDESGKKKSRSGCLWVAILLIALCGFAILIGILSIVGLVSSVSVPSMASTKVGADEFPVMSEIWSFGGGEAKVIRIPLTGMIMLGDDNSGFLPTVNPAQAALLAIRRATLDEEVRGIILQIDSGGGGITASDVLHKAVRDFKESRPDRVVVAIFGDVAASGAYYIAVAADHIIAHPTTITGSIGVLIQSLNAKELGGKIGISDVTIKSGKNKDLMNPLGEMSAEQRQMMQRLVDSLHGRFVRLVAEGRDMPLNTVRGLADGRIYSADEALSHGLIDELGYWDDAVRRTAALLGEDDIKVYRYEQEFSFSSLFRAAQHWNPVQGALQNVSRPRLMYQWSL